MKCIEGEYGNICKKGLITKKIEQGDHKLKASDIRKILKKYVEQSHTKNYFYGAIDSLDKIKKSSHYHSYDVRFNTEGYAINIGCKWYSRETVDRAIKAFL